MSKKIHGSYIVPTSYHKKRKRFLAAAIKAGSLDCYICGQTDLTTKCMEEKEIPDHRKATIDHIVPASMYAGSYLDTANWAICCLRCNRDKGAK